MVANFLRKNSQILTRPQKSILSAATVIMVMVAASRVLGLARNRILAYYFPADLLSVYFAAFRLPEVAFEILVFGTFAAAFIPIFTSYLAREEKEEAWRVAAASLNLTLLIFAFFGVLFFSLAKPLYTLMVPGFSPQQLEKTVYLARILLFTQGFFLLSYFSTAILESFKRFLVPAIAPLFYNLGIILGVIFLADQLGVIAPAVGALIGALMHFLIQVPLLIRLGFRPIKFFGLSHPGVRKIGRLAFPRMVEFTFLQVSKSLELYLASIIGAAAYTHLTFASSLRLLPVSLFGTSLAKASLPSLSYQASQPEKFKKIFLSSFNQILFLTLPFSVFLAVLRVPAVRLFFGAPRFDWESTVQTSFALSAFCLGISTQSLVFLLNRAYYALHDSLMPMAVSVGTIIFNAVLSLIAVLILKLPVWSLALVFSIGSFGQLLLLIIFIHKKKLDFAIRDFLSPFGKILTASLVSGGVMYFLLKILDRSAWDKRLSFLGRLGLALPTSFDIFVLDTRYTVNLIVVTFLVGLLGTATYLFLSWKLRIKEFFVLLRLLGKIEKLAPFTYFSQRFAKKRESITIEDPSQPE